MKKRLNILVTNDDGINASGIRLLAEMAKQFGDVTIVAPEKQCSGMSQKLTIRDKMRLCHVGDYPVEGVEAWSLDGTPADCVKAAVLMIMDRKPDIVFTGINYGLNTGYDCAYSGTVGSALEALLNGIPAIAYSNAMPNNDCITGSGIVYDVAQKYMAEITDELLNTEIEKSAFWNVNFPGCTIDRCRGILRGRTIAQLHPYKDNMLSEDNEDGSRMLYMRNYLAEPEETTAEEGTDIDAVTRGYISIGKIYSAMLI